MKCENCKTDKITEKVAEYSSKKLGKVLCYNCQKEGKTDTVSCDTITSIPQKDKLIIRQSCLKNATLMITSDLNIPRDDIFKIAEDMYSWVINIESNK